MLNNTFSVGGGRFTCRLLEGARENVYRRVSEHFGNLTYRVAFLTDKLFGFLDFEREKIVHRTCACAFLKNLAKLSFAYKKVRAYVPKSYVIVDIALHILDNKLT